MSKIKDYLKENKWLVNDRILDATIYTKNVMLSKWDMLHMKITEWHRNNELTVEKIYYFINEDNGSIESTKNTKDILNNLNKLKEYIGEQ